jgi:type I restriction enzyme R subunit
LGTFISRLKVVLIEKQLATLFTDSQMGKLVMDKADISFFDPKADWTVIERGLPHWSQDGCVCFVTWRLNDSLPLSALDRIEREVRELLIDAGFSPQGNWKQELAKQTSRRRGEIQWKLFAVRDKYLDQGFGACYLTDPQCSSIVIDSLKKFDMEKYFLTDAVIMPNHAHFLCAFSDGERFLKQCTEWKRFTGRQINKTLGLSGEFWQVDQFDHLVRSPEQFEYYRRYIAENPQKAGLPRGAYAYFRKRLT